MKTKRLSISFYLLSPNAKDQSAVYASISRDYERARFTTGESFVTAYCHKRGVKGKNFVKRNCAFFLEYTSALERVKIDLLRIDHELRSSGKAYTLENIREEYFKKAGLIQVEKIDFNHAWRLFLAESQNKWKLATQQHFAALYAHLNAFCDQKQITLELHNLDREFWNEFRDAYFAGTKKFSNNSTNKNLKKLKQFLLFAKKKAFINKEMDLSDFKYLEEIEPFKIALKLHEVKTLINLDLSDNNRLQRVRDLFLLEIMTGQRWSDLPALLDKNNIGENAITIFQIKTGEQVSIPLHPQLKTHLAEIFRKYPEGITGISNQKFNDYIKELCKYAGFDRLHSWVKQIGLTKESVTDFRYNLCSSHTGRRTYCTLAMDHKIPAAQIMKVSGHTNYEQFQAYIKVDDQDLDKSHQMFLQ